MSRTLERTKLPHPKILTDKLREDERTLEAYAHNPSIERAMAVTALNIVERSSNENHPTAQGLRLVGRLPDFLKARETMKDPQGVNERSRNQAVESMTEFNAVLRDIINHNPNMKMNELQAYVMSAAVGMSDGESMQDVDHEVRNVIDGMRHELAFEAALYRIDGVDDVRTATPEEDRKGVDVVIDYKGSPIKVDVKASMYGAQGKADSNMYYDRYDNAPIWSGFTWDDFGNQLRITDEAKITDQVRYVEEQLETIHDVGCKNYTHML